MHWCVCAAAGGMDQRGMASMIVRMSPPAATIPWSTSSALAALSSSGPDAAAASATAASCGDDFLRRLLRLLIVDRRRFRLDGNGGIAVPGRGSGGPLAGCCCCAAAGWGSSSSDDDSCVRCSYGSTLSLVLWADRGGGLGSRSVCTASMTLNSAT